PSAGAQGGKVSITGTGFGTVGGSVYFNGLLASQLSWSDTSIQVFVPGNATTGPVTVVESGISSAGFPFSVEGPPTVTSISPTVAGVNAQVTITGTGFGANQSSSYATVNGLSMGISSWSDTQIVGTIMPGSVSGPAGVTVANIGAEGPWLTVS